MSEQSSVSNTLDCESNGQRFPVALRPMGHDCITIAAAVV